MYKQRELYKQIKYELERCEKLYRKLKTEQKFLPQGSLATDIYENLYRMGRVDGQQYKVMLSDKDASLINKLKRRRYTPEALKVLQQRINNCKSFINNDTYYDPRAIEKKLPKQYNGLKGIKIFLEGDINEEEWSTAHYKTNPFPIKTPHYSQEKLCTRSKSEAMIATRLEERGEVFRYDAEVRLRYRSVYPDFTILDRKRRKIVYWEHLGRVDDEGYMFDNLEKLEEYAEAGLILGDNLFITYESKSRPLSIFSIDRKIERILG